MIKFFRRHLGGFVFGFISFPVSWFALGFILPGGEPDAKTLMPFHQIRQESTMEFWLPPDYSYTLRSKASHEEFLEFVKRMKMEGFKTGEDLYERRQQDVFVQISYDEGWVVYEKIES